MAALALGRRYSRKKAEQKQVEAKINVRALLPFLFMPFVQSVSGVLVKYLSLR